MSDFPNFGIWDKFGDHNDEYVARWVDPNLNQPEQIKPIYEAIGGLDQKKKVLDFGCGMGRNMVGMMMYAKKWTVIGYDNSSMVDRARRALLVLNSEDHARTVLLSDWNDVIAMASKSAFDVIFCCLTLQHIEEKQLRWFLEQFKSIGDELFVQGRRALDLSDSGYDGGKNFSSVWETVLDYGYEIKESQKGFSLTGNGNDHHWVKFVGKNKAKKSFSKIWTDETKDELEE